MKFSVIIPVYNGWEYLREGVDSVLGQTGADFEVLLVDDGSTDGESGALCDTLAREHPDCIRVLHKPNGGAGDARNVALPLAQGEYVLFLDSDDTYTPDAFAVLCAALDETQADVCYFGLRMTGDNDGAVFTDDLPLHTPLTLQEAPALLLNRPSACIAAWRRTLFTDTDIRFRARGSVRRDPAGCALPLPAARGLRDQARARRQRRNHGRDRRRADVVSGARPVRAV